MDSHVLSSSIHFAVRKVSSLQEETPLHLESSRPFLRGMTRGRERLEVLRNRGVNWLSQRDSVSVEAERAQSFLFSTELCTAILLEQKNSRVHSPPKALWGTEQANRKMEFSPRLQNLEAKRLFRLLRSFFWHPFPTVVLCIFYFFKIFFKDLFWGWPCFLKSLLNLLRYCFCFMFRIFGPKAHGILAPRSRIEPTPRALEGEGLITGPSGKSLL